jgi:hypothetical protein
MMSISKKRLLFPTLIVILLAIFAYLYFVDPDPTWDQSSQTVIINTSPWAMHIDYNYIPDVQVWGNGRIIWVEHQGDGSRQVKEGRLSESQIRSLLVEAIDIGIFKPFGFLWSKKGECPYSGVDNELNINLTHEQASEEWIRTASPPLCRWISFLSTGAGADGSLYQPDHGWLHAVPIGETGVPVDAPVVDSWPDEALPFDLQTVYEEGEVEISGEVLKLSWSIVNSSRNPIVLYRGKKYWIAVRVPGISP